MVFKQQYGAYILAQYGRMVALVFSFVFAVIPPLIGWWFVPETLGMRDIDFNKEKYEEFKNIIADIK